MTDTKLSKQEVVCDKCGDLIPMNKVHICKQDGEKILKCSTTTPRQGHSSVVQTLQEGTERQRPEVPSSSSPPCCLDEIPFNLLVCNCGCDVSGEKKLERYKRDVQEMVIRYIIEQENIWGDIAYTERINLMKVFNITSEMIEEYKQKEARER